jgi:hypothetical protein
MSDMDCPVCGKPKKHKRNKTCSYACSNKLFRSGKDNPNYNGESYRNKCFEEHGKACLVCGEDKIVAVHHVNENHEDNRVENLVPLCPTHHQYLHSRYKGEVQPYVDKYLAEKFT